MDSLETASRARVLTTYSPAIRADRDPLGRLSAWIEQNSGWLAIMLVAAAVALRLYYALSCYLNPEEALYFHAARPSSWHDALKASPSASASASVHPGASLDNLSLRAVRACASSSFACSRNGGSVARVRLDTAHQRRNAGAYRASVPGTLASRNHGCNGSRGNTACFSSFSAQRSTQTERAFSDRSAGWACLQGLLLGGTFLTHYTAVIPVCAIAIYSIVRALSRDFPHKLLWAFVAVEAAVAAGKSNDPVSAPHPARDRIQRGESRLSG